MPVLCPPVITFGSCVFVLYHRHPAVRCGRRSDRRPAALASALRPGAESVIAGHFGLAAAVKAGERRAPLWALMLATVWLDVVFVPLLAAGVERLDPIPGATSSYGTAIIHADYTHSLVG